MVGRSILIVEDEPLIAMMLEDFLDSLGHTVAAICDTVSEALDRVGRGGFDVAIIDVNLNGERVWPVADRLAAQGVPYILATGGHIEPPPPRHFIASASRVASASFWTEKGLARKETRSRSIDLRSCSSA